MARTQLSVATTAQCLLLVLSLAVLAYCDIHSPYYAQPYSPVGYRFLKRDSKQPLDAFVVAGMPAKREKPLSGYGWEQCEFSPMSCLLRRRRRAAEFQTAESFRPVNSDN
ncbi:hypothetical protein AAVH_32048 [Aphelenchoides avenae]|nr:hypothetical protein AAVH_32048 [Aphelenchus avenae]